MTRWQIFSQYLATYTNENLAKCIKIAKVGSIISPMQNEGFKNCQRRFKFGQSGDFSPNLVTLLRTAK